MKITFMPDTYTVGVMKRFVIPEMYLTAPVGGERPDE